MEAIKISVEVNVNLSENTQSFIKSLFGGACQCAGQKPAATPAPSAPAAPAAPAKPEEPKKPSAPAAAPAPTKPAATPAPSAPAAPAASSASKTIEDVRAELAKKVNDHRDAIKNKLTELGAPSVTKLDPSKYDEMYNFLAAL
jgi:hypothetical protein